MNSEEWECGDDCLALICVCDYIIYNMSTGGLRCLVPVAGRLASVGTWCTHIVHTYGMSTQLLANVDSGVCIHGQKRNTDHLQKFLDTTMLLHHFHASCLLTDGTACTVRGLSCGDTGLGFQKHPTSMPGSEAQGGVEGVRLVSCRAGASRQRKTVRSLPPTDTA
jgi:hypothetical protein